MHADRTFERRAWSTRRLRVIERRRDSLYRTDVVIYGEPGTGKQGLACRVHRLMHPDGGPVERTSLSGCSADQMLKQLLGADTYRSGDGGLHGGLSGAVSRAARFLSMARANGELGQAVESPARPTAPWVPT